VAVEREIALLRDRRHEVVEYRLDNRAIGEMGVISAGLQSLWSREAEQKVERLVREHRPQVMHVHNSFPLASPAVFWAAKRARVATFQTLHNFRLLCPQAMLVREGKMCEDCLGRFPLPGVVRGCYRGSRPQTAAAPATVSLHRAIGTYWHKVDRYVALNEFCRRKFIEGGLPSRKIMIKPNFAPLGAAHADDQRQGALFVGHLYPEKGHRRLGACTRGRAVASTRSDRRGPGNKPFGASSRSRAGWQAADVVGAAMRRASCLVLPSLWYENFPMVVIEAFASGLPVVASRIGGLAEVIEEGVTGLLFEPGNAAELVQRLRWIEANPESARLMGARARQTYEHRYTAAKNYERLMQIYTAACEENERPSRQVREPAYEV